MFSVAGICSAPVRGSRKRRLRSMVLVTPWLFTLPLAAAGYRPANRGMDYPAAVTATDARGCRGAVHTGRSEGRHCARADAFQVAGMRTGPLPCTVHQ